MLKPGKQKRKKTRIDIKDYKQKSSMKSGWSFVWEVCMVFIGKD
jgi:hypothetical protein